MSACSVALSAWEIAGLSFMMLTTSVTWGLGLGMATERLVTGRWWWNR
ncbi:hypothetical protein [Mycobacteroides franklinii]|nr:hypothetical protein [Mycobacteroides franklinii]